MKLSKKCIVFAVLIFVSGQWVFADDKNQARFTFESNFIANFEARGNGSPLPDLTDLLKMNKPFNETTLSLENEQGVGASITVKLVHEYWNFYDNIKDPDKLLLNNIPIGYEGNPVLFENNLIKRGVLYFPFFDGKVLLGRQDASFGPSNLSNLQLTRGLPYFDGIYYELPLGNWKISQLVASLENRQSYYSEASPEPTIEGDFEPEEAGYNYGDNIILLSSRRFAWSKNNVELAIGAHHVSTRYNNAFQFGDILPIFSIHNAHVGDNNFTLFFDGTYRLGNHNIYAIIGLDDINGNIAGVADSGVPTIWAFVLGAKGSHAFNSQIRLNYDIEGSATHYLWGSFEERYYLSRAIYRLEADRHRIALPLTSPFGPARMALEFKGDLGLPKNISAGLSGLLLFGDESFTLFAPGYEDGVKKASYNFLRAKLDGSFSVELLKGLSLAAEAGLELRPETKAFTRFGLSAKWQLSNKASGQ